MSKSEVNHEYQFEGFEKTLIDELEKMLAVWKTRNAGKHQTYLRECEKKQTHEETVGEAAMRFGTNVERNCIYELEELLVTLKAFKIANPQPPLSKLPSMLPSEPQP